MAATSTSKIQGQKRSCASEGRVQLANLVALPRMNLFTHRDLMAWLGKPFATPPDPQDNPQASLAFA